MKPRDPRHPVMVQARMRSGSEWSDVIIHNVSRRGMMLRAAQPPVRGSYIEVRKATMTIVGRAVWVRGQRFGVRTQDVIDMSALLDHAAQQLGAAIGLTPSEGERRRASRSAPMTPAQTAERNRQRAAIGQFALIAVVGGAAAWLIADSVHGMLAAPFDAIRSALGS